MNRPESPYIDGKFAVPFFGPSSFFSDFGSSDHPPTISTTPSSLG
jgi:hypothetical protein